MGERVEWRKLQDNADYVESREAAWLATAWDDGLWEVLALEDGRVAETIGCGSATDLASAKLAAEAALRERGLVGGEAVAPKLPALPSLPPLPSLAMGPLTWSEFDVGGFIANDKQGDVLWDAVVFPVKDAFEWRLYRHGYRMAAYGCEGTSQDAMRAAEVAMRLEQAAYADWAANRGGASAAMLVARDAFAALAAAMAMPQGRRVLAAQAVEEAVADGARRGLDAEALRIVLVGALETIAGDVLPSYIVGDIARDLESGGKPGWACVAYHRALAARSAKALGRPPRRRGVRGRAW